MCKSCRECDSPLTDTRQLAAFCSTPCKNRFNNRRAVRGAELYDLFMATRYQRGLAKVLGLWAIVCGLAATYREEDALVRPGFVSWVEPEKLLARKPSLRAVKGRV